MHSMGIHSALAIKRQRKRRTEARRAKERRHSTQSNDSGYNNSTGSLDKSRKSRPSLNTEGQTVTSIGMLHIGVVFLVLGTFLFLAGIVPDDISDWSTMFSKGWFNEMVFSGTFALFIGVFLIVLNKIVAKQEDDDLSEYVARQLTRTKSGQRLVRDVETGCMTTKNDRRQKLEEHVEEKQSPQHHVKPTEMSHIMDKGTHLELIVEEESSEKGEEESRCRSKESGGDSMSPSSPSETQELLAEAERYFHLAKK